MKNIPMALLAIGLMAASCKHSVSDPLDVPVVSIEDKVLTQRDLYEATPRNMTKADSTVYVQDYITRWVKLQLQLRKAELNLTDEEKDIEKQLEDYKASLLTHLYQQKLLEEKYAPMITSSEIESYYDKMKDNFKLNEDILKGIFIKLPQTAPNISFMEQLFRSQKPADMLELETYCIQNASKFDQFLESWVPFSQINREMPRWITDPGAELNGQRYYTTQDMQYNYYLSIIDIKYEDEEAPLEYATERIKSILLNKKRVEFLQQLENDLYDEGLRQKIVKFY